MSIQNKNSNKVRWLAKTGILTAVAAVLMYLEFPIPFMPAFLKFDFSEIAVLLAAFSMGPLTAILIELLKNAIHLLSTQTAGVGELANFIVGASFVGTAGLIYQIRKTRAGALTGMAAGTLAMAVVAVVVNYFITIPFYLNVMEFELDAIIGMSAAAGNTLVDSLLTLLLFVFVPFNLFKGLVISIVVALMYKRLSPLLHR